MTSPSAGRSLLYEEEEHVKDLRSLPDEDLVAQARQAPEGDLRAFDVLVLRHQEKVLTNCRYLTKSSNEAPDLAQEVFVKAFFGLGSFEGRSAFTTWLQRIKVNHCLNHLQRMKGRIRVDLEDPALQQSEELQVPAEAERAMKAGRDRARIGEVLDGLPDTLRIPLIMCDLDGLSYQEIAETLGIGLSAVKMRIKRAREQFRRRFEETAGSAVSPPAGEESP